MKWLRALTFVGAAACGVVAFFVPAAAPVLVPTAVGLVGWATTHPSDKIDQKALEELAQKAAEAALGAKPKP